MSDYKHFEVRRIGLSDLHRAQYLRWHTLRDSSEPMSSAIDEYDSETRSIHVAGFCEGLMASTGRVHFVDEEIGQVRYMATSPLYRGRGFGARVLELLEEGAAQADLTRLVLNARTPAVTLYERAGFSATGDEPFEQHGVEHVQMIKNIGKPEPQNPPEHVIQAVSEDVSLFGEPYLGIVEPRSF